MQYKFITALAAAMGMTQAAARTHGERSEINGVDVRWQQLARGVFTGVAANEWNDKLHKKSNAEWDAQEIASKRQQPHWPPHYNGSHPHHSPRHEPHWPPHYNGSHPHHPPPRRDLALEARNLVSSCQAIPNCVKSGHPDTLLAGVNVWIDLADYASHDAGQDLLDFLKQPFEADAGGVALAGVISGQIDSNTKVECSTSSQQADLLASVLNTVVASTPDSNTAALQLNGPSGSWVITVNAAVAGSNPVPTC